MRTATRIVPILLTALWLAPPGSAAAPCSVPGTHATIQAAILDAGCDPITVAPGTYAENLDVDRSVTIEGAGSALTTIDGSMADRVVVLDDGTARDLILKGLTITRGIANAAHGGGIGVTGSSGHSLTLDDVVVTKNVSSDVGGGVGVLGGASLQATNSTISMNETTGGPGGGLYLGASSATLIRVLFDGNEATGDGGGIYASDSSLTLQNSALTNNSANSFGGILSTADAIASLTNVTVSGNRVPGNGGGIGTINSGDITGTNVTIAANTADSDNEAGGVGGGIFRLEASGGPITLKNSIVAGNTDGSPPAATDCYGDITSNGHNILGSTTGCDWSAGPSDQLNVDPKLGPLADNGGNTLTHALLAGSPAVDAADPAAAPPTDQRGLARATPDIGAYELVLCKKVPVSLIGTEGDDTLTGGNEANGALAGGGNDTVNTGGGADAVCAGAGKDKVNGGGGKDQLFGEAGKDSLKGGGGKDKLNGGGGKDSCNGGGGKDKGKACEKERKI